MRGFFEQLIVAVLVALLVAGVVGWLILPWHFLLPGR
jgi:hypothetical protein